MILIDVDELEPDTEWNDYYDGYVSYSQSQIDEAEEVKAIPLEKVKQAREEIADWDVNKAMDGCSKPFRLGVARGLDIASEILDKLIEEVEG